MIIYYFFFWVSNIATPAKAIVANPAIGVTSPVLAAFAFVVVDSCPVCVLSALLSSGVSVDGFSTGGRVQAVVELLDGAKVMIKTVMLTVVRCVIF